MNEEETTETTVQEIYYINDPISTLTWTERQTIFIIQKVIFMYCMKYAWRYSDNHVTGSYVNFHGARSSD
ncbi:hypothetical protein KHA80_06465 [Anaerobacillus sp. HL2]|nr:hypothetical protein KHA80_06465 [Anaerobacillus sp. HL2]